MSYDAQTIGTTQLDTFVNAIPGIYSAKDELRSLWDVWLHANHHAASIGEEVRKAAAGGELLTEIADFSMWLFTAVQKLHGNIGVKKSSHESDPESLVRIRLGYSDLLWNKYPSMCPVCYWRRTSGDRTGESNPELRNECDCLLHDVERRDQSQKRRHVKALRAFADEHRHEKPTGVDAWQQMFARIFAANLRHLTLTDIAFHLLEEMGEVSDAIVRMYTYRDEDFVDGGPDWQRIWLEEELADVSSWMFALVEKLDLMRQTAVEYDKWRFGEAVVFREEKMRLSQIIWRRYGSDKLRSLYCPHCRKQVCNCAIVLVPMNRSVEELVRKVKDR